MDKILLLGEVKENTECIETYLEDTYRVQRCSMIMENVEGMIRIIHPDLIIACQHGTDPGTLEIYKWLKESQSTIPILMINSSEVWDAVSGSYSFAQWETLFTPLGKDELRLKCSVMIANSREYDEDNSDLKRILLVDDNAIVLRNIKALLQEKYDVSLAVSGAQALKMVEKKKPDLILLDYEMPEMNGAETFECLRKMDEGKDIPVVFLTGVSDKERIVEVLKLNPAGYVLKPPKQDKLWSVLDEALNKGLQ